MSTAAPLQNTAAKSLSVSKASHAGLLLQRKCACGGPASLTGECEECNSKRLQKKLSIGASNDPLEKEADRVADQVLAAPVHSAVSGVTPRIQRFTVQSMGQADIAPASVDRVLASSGRPLEPVLRENMEQRFGYDFSQVRVHSGAAAEQSAQDVNAHAYTVGQDLVFAQGQYQPYTEAGRKLLAHELTHVLQQSGAYGNSLYQNNENYGESTISLPVSDGCAAAQRVQRQPNPKEEMEFPAEWAFAADKHKRTSRNYARSLGRKDAARIRKIGKLSPEDRDEVNAKLGFFEGEAHETYLQVIKPVLLEVTREEIEIPAEYIGTSTSGEQKGVVLGSRDDEAEVEMPDLGPKRPSLLMDYSGPEVCGGRPCFTDEDIYASLSFSASEASSLAEDYDVDINAYPVVPLAPDVFAVPTAPAAALPAVAKPPPGSGPGPKIVQGAKKSDVRIGAKRMARQTGYERTTFGKGRLANTQEVTIIAHGRPTHARIGKKAFSARDLANALVESGWKGGTVRLVICKTGLCGIGKQAYAQSLANELAILGVDSAVIAPGGGNNAAVGSKTRLPRVVIPPPPSKPDVPPEGKPLGKGWEIFTAEVPEGQPRPTPATGPGTGRGGGAIVAESVAFFALSILHGKAVEKRAEQQRNETGFAPYGPTGDTLYDIGAWFLDPTDEAGRSIPFSQRFEMSTMRRTMKEAADRKKPGEYYRCSWTTSDGEDSFGTPKYRKFYAKYRKGANGYWYTISCEDCEGEDFPPDLNKIIDPEVSDEEIRVYLDLPGTWSDLA